MPLALRSEVHFPPLRDGPGAGAAPIGMFDSGVGGLTVVAALMRRLPHERVVYLADQGHVPYGGRPLSQIRAFARNISAMLARVPVKAIVMACNISSATTHGEMSEVYGAHRVFGMVGPGARQAAACSRNGRIGVVATAGTVASGAYSQTLRALDPRLEVVEVACPRFVPLVEGEMTETEDAVDAAREYLGPIERAGCDVVVLGCTHYPYLLTALEAASTSALTFVDPAEAVADDLVSALTAAEYVATTPSGPHLLMTTGNPERLEEQVQRFLPGTAFSVHGVKWEPSER